MEEPQKNKPTLSLGSAAVLLNLMEKITISFKEPNSENEIMGLLRAKKELQAIVVSVENQAQAPTEDQPKPEGQ